MDTQDCTASTVIPARQLNVPRSKSHPAIPTSSAKNAREAFGFQGVERNPEKLRREKRGQRTGSCSNPREYSASGTTPTTSGQKSYVPRHAARTFASTTDAVAVARRGSTAWTALIRVPTEVAATTDMTDPLSAATWHPTLKGAADDILQPRNAGLQTFNCATERRRLYEAGLHRDEPIVAIAPGDNSYAEVPALVNRNKKRPTRETPQILFSGGAHAGTNKITTVNFPKRPSNYDRNNWAQASQCGNDVQRASSMPALPGMSASATKKEANEKAPVVRSAEAKRTSFDEQYQAPSQEGMIAEAVRLIREQATAPAVYASSENGGQICYPNVIDISDLSCQRRGRLPIVASANGPAVEVGASKSRERSKRKRLVLRRYFRPEEPVFDSSSENEGKPAKLSNWMDMIEQMGIKNGIMIDDERWEAPIVRY